MVHERPVFLEKESNKGPVTISFERNLQQLTSQVNNQGAKAFYKNTLKPLVSRLLVGDTRKALDSQVLEKDRGQKVKPVLLVLPGATEGKEEYLPELFLFKDTHRVIVPDIPTLNPSAIPQELHALLAQLHIAPTTSIDVYGTSIGGVMAQQFQEQFPQQVRSLILSHTSPQNYPSWKKLSEGMLPLVGKHFLKIPWQHFFRHVHQRFSDSRFFTNTERRDHVSENAVLRDLYRLAAADHHVYATQQEAYIYTLGVLAIVTNGKFLHAPDTSFLENVVVISSPTDTVIQDKKGKSPSLADWQHIYPYAHNNFYVQQALSASRYGHHSSAHRSGDILRAVAEELDSVYKYP